VESRPRGHLLDACVGHHRCCPVRGRRYLSPVPTGAERWRGFWTRLGLHASSCRRAHVHQEDRPMRASHAARRVLLSVTCDPEAPNHCFRWAPRKPTSLVPGGMAVKGGNRLWTTALQLIRSPHQRGPGAWRRH